MLGFELIDASYRGPGVRVVDVCVCVFMGGGGGGGGGVIQAHREWLHQYLLWYISV